MVRPSLLQADLLSIRALHFDKVPVAPSRSGSARESGLSTKRPSRCPEEIRRLWRCPRAHDATCIIITTIIIRRAAGVQSAGAVVDSRRAPKMAAGNTRVAD